MTRSTDAALIAQMGASVPGPQGSQGSQGNQGAQGSQGNQGSQGGGAGAGGPDQVLTMQLAYRVGALAFIGLVNFECRIDMYAADHYGTFGGNLSAAILLPAVSTLTPRISMWDNLPAGKQLRCSFYSFDVQNTAATQHLNVANSASATTASGASGETFCDLPQLNNTQASTGSDLTVVTSVNHGANTGVKTTAGGLFLVNMMARFFYI